MSRRQRELFFSWTLILLHKRNLFYFYRPHSECTSCVKLCAQRSKSQLCVFAFIKTESMIVNMIIFLQSRSIPKISYRFLLFKFSNSEEMVRAMAVAIFFLNGPTHKVVLCTRILCRVIYQHFQPLQYCAGVLIISKSQRTKWKVS